MFGLVVRFDLKNGHAEAFDQLAVETLERIKTDEPGTVFYGCHKVAGEPNARIFYELYDNRDAFEAHERTDYVKRFLAEREQHFAAPPRVEFFDSFTGKGLPFDS